MPHLPHLILDLALILSAAGVVSLIFKWLRQPVVLGYILAGFFVGPYFDLFPTVVEGESIKTWAEIGVLFLLFGLGLEFSFKKLFKLGGVAAVTAFFGVGLTMLVGYFVGRLLGWENIDALFFGGMLSIASTTIIIRAFDELGTKNQKFASVVMGVLVVEDLVAVVLMVLLTTVSISRTFEGAEMVYSIAKLLFFLILWFVSGIYFLPTILKSIRKYLNDETLLVISIALCFGMVYLADKAGFSPALGAFIMGSILAETSKAEKIEHGIKSLKNLFGAIFFVSVGMMIDPTILIDYAVPVVLATLILLLGKPFFVLCGALLTGQPLKVAVQSGMSLSQIGEFSFIIAQLGLALHVTSEFLYPVAVAVSVLTTFTTPFMIRLSEPVYKFFEKKLPASWTDAISSYSVSSQRVRELTAWQQLIRFYLLNVIIFSVIIVTIILICTQYVTHFIDLEEWNKLLIAFLTLALISPFLYALAFRRASSALYSKVWSKPAQRAPLLVLMFARIGLAVFFVGMLFGQLFSPWIALAGILATLLLLFIARKRIRESYSKIEGRFLHNLHDREESQTGGLSKIAPWGSHITPLEIGESASIVGLMLKETKLREKYGINIAAIKRGERMINVPGRNERLFPKDLVYLIGTDEEIQRLKTEVLETNKTSDLKDEPAAEVTLHSLVVNDQSALVGKSIRASAIRERSKGLVVGVERDGKRILNPESDFVFHAKDVIWIAGDDRRLRILLKESEAKN